MTPRIQSDDAEESARWRRLYGELLNEAAHEEPHPDEEVWLRLSCNELDEPAQARLAAHVVRCAECARVYRGIMELQREAGRLDEGAPRHVPVTGPRPPLFKMALAIAAALAVVVAGAILFMTFRGSATVPQQALVATTRRPEPPPPARLPRVWALNVRAPEVTLPAGLALSMRGGQAEARRFLEEFGAAMVPFRAGQYAAASTQLEILARRYPDRDAARFYLGVARLFAGRPAEAAEALAAARSSATYGPAATWFSAVALERAGDHQAADLMLAELCGREGPYRDSACDAQQAAPRVPDDAPR